MRSDHLIGRLRVERGFTLVELLAATAIIVVLATVIFKAGRAAYVHSSLAVSAANIRVLSVGATQYLAENNHRYWKFYERASGGKLWWWGFEPASSANRAEGDRFYDPSLGPLGPFIPAGTRPDPSFSLNGSTFKPKFRSGYIGVGYNVLLAGGWVGPIVRPPTARATGKPATHPRSSSSQPARRFIRFQLRRRSKSSTASISARRPSTSATTAWPWLPTPAARAASFPPTNPPSTNECPKRKSDASRSRRQHRISRMLCLEPASLRPCSPSPSAFFSSQPSSG